MYANFDFLLTIEYSKDDRMSSHHCTTICVIHPPSWLTFSFPIFFFLTLLTFKKSKMSWGKEYPWVDAHMATKVKKSPGLEGDLQNKAETPSPATIRKWILSTTRELRNIFAQLSFRWHCSPSANWIAIILHYLLFFFLNMLKVILG